MMTAVPCSTTMQHLQMNQYYRHEKRQDGRYNQQQNDEN